jgi:hypothetical protein
MTALWLILAAATVLTVAWRLRVANRKATQILREETTTETSVAGYVSTPPPVTDHNGI